MSNREIICNPIFPNREFQDDEKTVCFVIMPFSVPLLQDVYRNTIRPTVESLNINCIRGDDIFSVRTIMEDVWGAICKSDFILGEFTGRNPNVLYEAGIAHTLGKPLICLTQNIEDIPFDFRHLRHIIYENSPTGYKLLEQNLKKTIEAIIAEPFARTPRPYLPPSEENMALRAELLDMRSRHANLLMGIEERILNQHDYYHQFIANLKAPLTSSERDEYLANMAFCRVEGGEVNVDFYAEEQGGIIRIGTEIVDSFFINKYPITNLQYQLFLSDSGHPPPETWVDGMIPEGTENHPALGMSWVGVQSYCKWFSRVLGKPVRIPSEAEWLRAAGYSPNQRYPWGNIWKTQSCNSKEMGLGVPTPVDMFEGKGDSPYGCVDMLGNVWEWTTSLHDYRGGFDFRWRAVRGGANYSVLKNLGSLARLWANPGHFLYVRDLGFRVVYDA